MLLRLLNWVPEGERFEPVIGTAPLWNGQRPLRVLTWNIQYCGSRRHHYFYDGGPDVFPDPLNVQAALGEIRRTLAALQPDIALLQEVDRDSDRTGRIDQLALLAEGFSNYVSTPYHRCRFLPHPSPPLRPLGRIDFHLAILSQVRLGPTRRIPLPGLNEPAFRAAFNLHRAILSSAVPVADGSTLHVAVAHLSAFSRGDGTMGRQVATIADWMRETRQFVFGADFNLLPPEDNPERLGADAREYVEPVLGQLDALAQRRPVSGEFTYLPPGSQAPDRTLDHLLVGGNLEVVEHRVVPLAPWVSDHWPVMVTVRKRT